VLCVQGKRSHRSYFFTFLEKGTWVFSLAWFLALRRTMAVTGGAGETFTTVALVPLPGCLAAQPSHILQLCENSRLEKECKTEMP
jgi:hypothetical protein